MEFELVTPDGVTAKEHVDQLTLPTMEGQITILPHHLPLVAQLVPGVLTLWKKGGQEDLAVSGGFIQVSKEGLIRVFADTAERGEDLYLQDILDAKARAQAVMQEKVRVNDEAYAHAAAALERELARERVARKYQPKKQKVVPAAGPTDDTGTV